MYDWEVYVGYVYCIHVHVLLQQGDDDDSSGVKLSRKELKKLKKQKQYSDQLEALKSEDQFTLSQAEKSTKASNLTDNALDIKVS